MAPDHATFLRMIQASKAALAAGRSSEAEALLARVAQLAPAHPAVLNELGLRMMQRGEAGKARELFQRATLADPNHPALWSNLASSLHALRLPQDEMEAIERALALEPRHLAALLQKGKAWVFDDTFEHEAWNGSETPRAILIFDIWNPYLSEDERELVRAAIETVGTYYHGTAGRVA